MGPMAATVMQTEQKQIYKKQYMTPDPPERACGRLLWTQCQPFGLELEILEMRTLNTNLLDQADPPEEN